MHRLYNYGIGIHLIENPSLDEGETSNEPRPINPKDNHISFQVRITLVSIANFFFFSILYMLMLNWVKNRTVHRCRESEEETGGDGDELRDSGGRGGRNKGGSGVLPRPGRLHDRDLQLRQHPDPPAIFLPLETPHAIDGWEQLQFLWYLQQMRRRPDGDGDDGEPEYGHLELLLLRWERGGALPARALLQFVTSHNKELMCKQMSWQTGRRVRCCV